MVVSLNSSTQPLAQVFDAANTVLAQKLSRVEGVGQVFVGGGQQPAVRVQIDPERLAGVASGSRTCGRRSPRAPRTRRRARSAART